MPIIACTECGFSIQTTGKGRPDYGVKSDESDFIKKCRSFERLGSEIRMAVPVADHMTNCPHLTRAITAALLPSAL